MAKTGTTQEERQLMKLVESIRLPDEEKASWLERIRTGQMSDELAEEIRAKLAGMDVDEQGAVLRTRHLAELAMLVKRWRFTNQSHNFSRH